MSLGDVTRRGVLSAIDECDRLGREEFLERFAFGPASGYTLIYQRKLYDSKAIVGVAHKFDRPEQGVLQNLSGGRRGAAQRLRKLDFMIEQSAIGDAADLAPRAWVIRAGLKGEAEELALAEGVAVIGWSLAGALSAEMTRSELKALVGEAYDDDNPSKLANAAGQLFRFINDVAEGDVVVLPLRTNRAHVAIGRVEGKYEYRSEAQFLDSDAINTRRVNWLADAVPYDHFPEDLQLTFSQQGTITDISNPDAATRLLGALDSTSTPTAWMFQANPQIWDLAAALEVLSTMQWVTRQSYSQIKAGDEVHLWQAGSQAGVLARGRVLTPPTVEGPDPSAAAFALGNELDASERRVWLSIERRQAEPLARSELQMHPRLKTLEILKFSNATNFRVDPAAAAELRTLEDARDGRDVEPEKLFFFTAAGGPAARRLQTSLRDGVPLSQLKALREIYPLLERYAVDGRVYAWGARPGSAAEKKWERLNPGDVALVYAYGKFAMWGRVYAMARSAEVAQEIWGEHKDESWDCMYFLSPVEPLEAERIPVVTALGYKQNYIPQGFEIPSEQTQSVIRAEHPTLMHFVRSIAGVPDSQEPRVWWVCQGGTYAAERDLSLMWAPKKGKNGASREFWRALEDARKDDVVLHYANGSVRAVSTVAGEAVDASKPEDLGGAWADHGWLVRTSYRELSEPVDLGGIPYEWRVTEGAPFTKDGTVRQGYFFGLSKEFAQRLAARFPQFELPVGESLSPPAADTGKGYIEPAFARTVQLIKDAGLRLDEQTIRRYHLSLKTRGFVVLSGLSGSGKSWLAELYANAVQAKILLVSVAPNWTANEDLLGYYDPLTHEYRHTPFSRFLEEAAAAWTTAERAGVRARPYHLILDEMNLARVEYYFAKFLSAMEIRAREESARLELDASTATELTPNLCFVGTVNVDETTHGFADKIYDRAQLIEIPVKQEAIQEHLADRDYRDRLLKVWVAMHPVAPFAYRVLDEIHAYIEEAAAVGISTDVALDEQLLQKVLPKIKGTAKGIDVALKSLIEDADGRWPLSRAKAEEMLADFEADGFTSYF
jgi:predicted Mrr-cat superfamily restriction endonuclease